MLNIAEKLKWTSRLFVLFQRRRKWPQWWWWWWRGRTCGLQHQQCCQRAAENQRWLHGCWAWLVILPWSFISWFLVFCFIHVYLRLWDRFCCWDFHRVWWCSVQDSLPTINFWKKNFSVGEKNRQAYFSSMNIEMMDLWMLIEGTKLIFIMNFSVVDFFKFASRMPQIACVKLVSTFKIFQWARHTTSWAILAPMRVCIHVQHWKLTTFLKFLTASNVTVCVHAFTCLCTHSLCLSLSVYTDCGGSVCRQWWREWRERREEVGRSAD